MAEEEGERRSTSRRNVNLQVEYPDLQGYPVDVTESVSPSGILIRSSQHHRVGESLRLAVSLPGFPDSLPVTGVVARIREATADRPRAVALHIAHEEFQQRLSEVLSPAARREFSLSSGPYSVLAALPRVRLATTPTPLHRAARLSKHLGGPDIWFKRDDLSGFALGGNKVRKMEIIAADALEKRADTLVPGAHSLRSSRIRVMSAVAARLGLKAVAVVNEIDGVDDFGFSDLLGTELRQAPDSHSSVDDNIATCVEELRAEGARPYGVTENEASWLGAVGYVLASIETIVQLRRLHLSPQVMVCPVASAETMSGLVVAQRWLDCSYDILGISASHSEEWCAARVATIASEVCSQLRIADTIPVDDIWVNGDYAPSSPGAPSTRAAKAIETVARLEGIFLDPEFSGRAMAGLCDLIRRGELAKGQSVVFLHTGSWA